MKRNFLILTLSILSLFVLANSAFAQKQITPQVERDPVLEADAKHNLEVAQQYFKLKKAYRGVLLRFEETYAAYPQFSKMDEFLYYAGMSSFYLAQNKGRQKSDAQDSPAEKAKYAPEKLREDAAAYLSKIVKDYPQSAFKTDAEKTLKQIDGKK